MKKYILIFRTSVRNKQDIKRIETLFVQFPQIDKWHVDLENWEKVLRIECREMIPATILNALQTIHIYAIASVVKPIGLTTSRSFSP